MNKQMLKSLPPTKFLYLFFGTLLFLYVVEYFFVLRFADDSFGLLHGMRMGAATGRLGVIVLGVAAWGVYRVFMTHPAIRPAYRDFIAISPWRFGLPLPFGSVQLTPVDFVFIASIDILASLQVTESGSLGLGIAFSAFLVFYVITLSFTIDRRFRWVRWATLFVVPLFYFPHQNFMVGTVVLLFAYIVLRKYHILTLKQYPWNTVFWTVTPYEILLTDAKKGISKLTASLSPQKDFQGLGILKSLLLSLLAAYYIVIFSSFKDGGTLLEEFIFFGAFLGLFRYLVYMAPGYLPPISIWGRIRTGRLVIPAYDRVFIAPILCASLAFTGKLWIPLDISFLFWFGMFFSAIYSPDYRQWRLTAPVRILTMPVDNNQKKQNEQQLKDVFASIRFGR